MTSTWRLSEKIIPTKHPPTFIIIKNMEFGAERHRIFWKLISQLFSTVIPNYYFNRQSYLLYLLNAASVIDGHCVIKSMTINDLLTTK